MDEYVKMRDLIFDDGGRYLRNIMGVRTAPLATWYEVYFYTASEAAAFKALRDELRVSSR